MSSAAEKINIEEELAKISEKEETNILSSQDSRENEVCLTNSSENSQMLNFDNKVIMNGS